MDLLIAFVKAPRPGGVKTRLVPPLEPAAAASLYRALAEAELRNTAPLADEYRRVLCYAPVDARAEIAAWLPGEDLDPQAEGDLGQRMAAAFDSAFARGAGRVVLIGSDVPWLTREAVLQAFAALDWHDLVLGPARDGGYYLIALNRPRPQLFQGVPWSTPAVLAATVELASGLGLSVHRLEVLSDVDTPDDLRREWPRLRPMLYP